MFDEFGDDRGHPGCDGFLKAPESWELEALNINFDELRGLRIGRGKGIAGGRSNLDSGRDLGCFRGSEGRRNFPTMSLKNTWRATGFQRRVRNSAKRYRLS